jgi:hypothetical protein
VPKRDAAGEVHNLINKERHKRGLPHVYWSREMYRLAKNQANYCAKVGRLVHSKRFAFRGGENLCGGKGKFSPRTIVATWMRSKAGHREYLLSPRVRKAAIAIATSKRGTYAAWAFSDKSPDPHDCPYYKTPRPKPKTPFKPKGKAKGGDQGVKGGWLLFELWTGIIAWVGMGIFGISNVQRVIEQFFPGDTIVAVLLWAFAIAAFIKAFFELYRLASPRRRRAR